MWLAPSETVILGESLDQNDLQAFIDEQEWDFENEFAASDEMPYHVVWMTLDRQTRIRYIEDKTLEVRYFYFSGHDAPQLASAAREQLPVVDPESLLHHLETAPDDAAQPDLLILCAIGFREASTRLMALLEAALKHHDADRRAAGLDAASYAEWPELEQLLEHVARSDDVHELREHATELLSHFRDNVWPFQQA